LITPVVIEPLSLLWCIGIGVSIAISFLILQIGIRIPPDTRRLLMIGMGIIMISIEIAQQLYIYHLGLWNIQRSMPIHLCGIAGILAGIMMFKPNQDGFEFLALIGSPGALHALLTPQLNHGDLTFLVLKYYIGHTGIILIPLFLAIVQGYRVRNYSWLRVVLFCQLLIIFIGSFNYFTGSNYMYLLERPSVTSPMIIGNWPWYILGFEILGIVHIVGFYFGYRSMKPLPY